MIDLNNTAIITKEHDVTYSELLQHVAQFARKSPKGKGTKTVIFSENREGWAYSFFSVWLNEGIAVPVDASSTASDVAYILNDCRPDAVWVSKEKEAVLRESLAQTSFRGEGISVLLIDDYEHLSVADEPSLVGPERARQQRHGNHHLHLRHNRFAEGCHAQLCQPESQRA